MEKLNSFNERELQTILKMTRILSDEHAAINAPASFSLDLTASESEAQAERQALELAARRKAGHGGRFLVDADNESKDIRAGIKDWMRRTRRLKKYGVD